jgi:hypothetical protein
MRCELYSRKGNVSVMKTECDTTQTWNLMEKADRNPLRYQRGVCTNLLFKPECGIYSTLTLTLTQVCCGNHVDIFVNVFPTPATVVPILLPPLLLSFRATAWEGRGVMYVFLGFKWEGRSVLEGRNFFLYNKIYDCAFGVSRWDPWRLLQAGIRNANTGTHHSAVVAPLSLATN